ncbi:hypothetical protein A0J57_05490 [Sphingobium sp. 22B]|nr:hypothetical protein AXW74_11770 [Sphingobium sp. AM]KYC33561.1 hypothetical protein A0J57_05490 [Sphingobium sp. 22B]OAP32740.1 hypothetical protein A8O16_07605 [Sphingobium sp. 20006FA]
MDAPQFTNARARNTLRSSGLLIFFSRVAYAQTASLSDPFAIPYLGVNFKSQRSDSMVVSGFGI